MTNVAHIDGGFTAWVKQGAPVETMEDERTYSPEVLDVRGAVLAEGPYAEVARNPQVIEAYMGTAEAAHG